jgi:hypothetical protein
VIQLASRFRVNVSVVGFCMGESEAAQVAKIATAGRGIYYDAKKYRRTTIERAQSAEQDGYATGY